MGEVEVLTVGHSNQSADGLLALLRGAGVQRVVDVRSAPYSRFNPQFSKREIDAALLENGVGYTFLGRALGGRPDDPAMYDPDGHVRYDLVARLSRFQAALDRLVGLAERERVAILCAEEDPTGCHRRLLVGRALSERAVTVGHLRGDGRIDRDQDLESQLTLFDEWRSKAPVRRGS